LLEDGRNHLLLSGPISIDCPLRLLQGMADEAVPWQTALRISENVTSVDVEVTFIKSGDHRLSSAADLERLFTVIDALPPLPDPQ
jgi:esterase/lipase